MIFPPFYLLILMFAWKQGVCHNVTKVEELWKFKYITMRKYNLQKNPLQETKILQDIITL